MKTSLQTNIGQWLRDIYSSSGPASWVKKWQAFRTSCVRVWALQELEKVLISVRAHETVQGTADRIFAWAKTNIEKADRIEDIEEAFGLSKQKLLHVPQQEGQKPRFA